METLSMGMYMRPYWKFAQEKVVKFREEGNEQMVQFWIKMERHSKKCRHEISRILRTEPEVSLNWSLISEKRFDELANEWKRAMPEFEFEIGPYRCIVRKRKETSKNIQKLSVKPLTTQVEVLPFAYAK